jgi:uncharacterized phage protein gp47/JayE
VSYDEILERMLSKVPSNVDKREGSIIYDALAPCAYELAQMYFSLENFLDLVFVDTSVQEYLTRFCSGFGVERKMATKAVRKGVFNTDISIGSRFSIQDIVYRVIEKIDIGLYKLECEQAGVAGNQYSGKLQTIDNISGLTSAELTDILIDGTDTETDEALRERFYLRVQMPATSGNAYHYKQWALEVEGVGDCKVLPLWNGNGTVKILVVDNDKNPATEALKSTVQEHIGTYKPIGATVTIDTPTAKAINISGNLMVDNSVSLESITSEFKQRLTEYLKEMVFEKNFISYAIVGSLLLQCKGVVDYSHLTLNEETDNIIVTDSEVPKIGTILLSEG